eukprot:TRINITY_DN4597_c0_g1_i2.p4 TRINITY_DN4597_c0_g1~~TRINITY_DN4597_c0_g1_i2.p4  ORF type:complete len:137 (+),score=9.67 TRINITY_DN4597_c0_g1_i2:1336-1746(+)
MQLSPPLPRLAAAVAVAARGNTAAASAASAALSTAQKATLRYVSVAADADAASAWTDAEVMDSLPRREREMSPRATPTSRVTAPSPSPDHARSTTASPLSLFLVTTSPCWDWVICAPAAFLGCGSRFSGSLSGIEP